MKNLLYKELRLALHPAAGLFLALSAMLLIPSYPYYVVFFYTTLGIFFICMTGRENHDIEYSLSLPIRKRDIVRSRMLFCVLLELAQFALAVPFALLRASFGMPNDAGMDANIALFGLSFAMLGLFNFAFFRRYYARPDRVGRAFVVGSIVVGVFIVLAEASVHIIPLMRDQLDTHHFEYLPLKLAVLGGGMLVFALCTLLAYRKAVRSFEQLDL